MRLLLFCVFILASYWANAQKLSGKIVSAETEQVLQGATISISQNGEFIGGSPTDTLGRFNLDLVPGNYLITIQYLGYKTTTIDYVQREGGGIVNYLLIAESLVGSGAIITSRALREPNTTLISKEFFDRIPGAFSDPSRLTIKFPGISSTNDQSNEIIVRGLAPHLSSWSINGAPIVNPNHLSNAGTITDLASASGGGVNMISGSAIKNYEFFNNPVNEDYHNVAGGISNTTLDISKGLQVALGVLGTELSYARENEKIKYGINYRYSTLGILSAVGVPLGDEKINFQDVHFHVSRKSGRHLFSNDFLYGVSSNLHESLGQESVLFKDALFIKFEGAQLINSFAHRYKKNNWAINNVINLSMQDANRIARNDSLIVSSEFENTEDFSSNKLASLKSDASYKYSSKIEFKGVLQYKLNSKKIIDGLVPSSLSSMSYLTAGINYRNDKFKVSVFPGISYQDLIIGKLEARLRPELRASIEYSLNQNKLKLAYSRQSIELIDLLVTNFYGKAIDADNVSLDYYINTNRFYFQAGLFYNHYSNLPVNPVLQVSYFDRIDLINQARQENDFVQNGSADQYGLQMQFEYFIYRKLQFISALSLYDLLVEQEGRNIESSFNFNYTYANTISYTADIGSKRLVSSLSIQGRGAGYESVIDEERSLNELNTTFDLTAEKKRTLNPYFRIDVKVDYLWGKNHRNRIGLDVQNASNQKNDAYFYFDPLLNNIQKQNQLGIIPILKYTYKIF